MAPRAAAPIRQTLQHATQGGGLARKGHAHAHRAAREHVRRAPRWLKHASHPGAAWTHAPATPCNNATTQGPWPGGNRASPPAPLWQCQAGPRRVPSASQQAPKHSRRTCVRPYSHRREWVRVRPAGTGRHNADADARRCCRSAAWWAWGVVQELGATFVKDMKTISPSFRARKKKSLKRPLQYSRA